jgi:hypothetical protein
MSNSSHHLPDSSHFAYAFVACAGLKSALPATVVCDPVCGGGTIAEVVGLCKCTLLCVVSFRLTPLTPHYLCGHFEGGLDGISALLHARW